jgi:serine/threonine protein kinase/lipopolysaccharide biosynthesis regulator YciM
MIGKTISHYKILEKLGEGGMGVVYKAQDTKLDRKVALKFLPKHLLCDESAKTRFVHEAKAASALNHTNITTIYEIDEVASACFICMEYIEGKSIKELIKEKTFSIEEIVNISVQIAEGLNAAHKKGIVHRDIKSDNIMITNDALVKIMDFGLAKLKGVSRVTKAGTTLGTVSYMSPEQARGEEVDHRTDIWSLGVVLYEMFTRQLPFKGEYEQAVIYAILNEKPNPIADLRTDLPGELEPIVNKALAKSPDSRYQKAEDIVIDLKELRNRVESVKEQTLTKKLQPSIAVLPFVDMSPQKDQEYFCDGMAEELINALTKIEKLQVVSRTSAFQFKGKAHDIHEVGRKLKVQTVLEGSVRKAGNRLRITAQLVDVADGYHLWSEKYDRDMEDIFAIQDEISLAIVDKLKVKLLGGEKENLVKRYTDNIEAYNLYLKGRYFWSKRTEQGLKKGIEYFKRATKKDAHYALAYAGLADSYSLLCSYHILSPEESIPRAETAAKRAMEIDDSLAEAYEALAHVRILYDWNWSESEQEFKRAIQVNPGFATAHQRYSLLLTVTGQLDEAIVQIKQAQELEPLSLIINTDVALIFYIARQYDRAIEQSRNVIEMDPNFGVAHFVLGLAYEQKKSYKDAIQELQQGISASGGITVMTGALGHTYAVSGNRDKALTVLNELKELSKRRYVSPYSIAIVYIGLGEKDQAFEWLQKAYEDRSVWLIHLHLKVDPRLDSLRRDARFKALLKKMGLAK